MYEKRPTPKALKEGREGGEASHQNDSHIHIHIHIHNDPVLAILASQTNFLSLVIYIAFPPLTLMYCIRSFQYPFYLRSRVGGGHAPELK